MAEHQTMRKFMCNPGMAGFIRPSQRPVSWAVILPNSETEAVLHFRSFGGLALVFTKSRGGIIEEAAMRVHLEIPEDLARQLAAGPGGVTRAALEAVALEGVRSGKFTVESP